MSEYFRETSQQGRCGYVFSTEEAGKSKQIFEQNTSSRFVVLKSDGHFGKMRVYDGNQIIQWDYSEKDVCVPFILIGNKMYECHRGKDWKASFKRQRKEARIKETIDDPEAKKMRKPRDTKKAGCPARIVMREVLMFPAFQVTEDTAYKRKLASANLKQELNKDPSIGERRIYIEFPRDIDHQGHCMDDSDRDELILDPQIIARIHELQTSSQVQTIAEMKFLLKEFVTDVLCKEEELPHKKDRRYFPTVSDIRKILSRSLNPHHHSKSVLVVHCQEAHLTPEILPNLEVRIIDDVQGEFEVEDGNNSEDVNTVSFNSNNGTPSCSCSDWTQGDPPCQHFRAVFALTSWGEDRLPRQYRTSEDALSAGNEYFVATLTPNLDNVLVTDEICNEEEIASKETEEKNSSPEEICDGTVEDDSLEEMRLKCREQLHRIEDLTNVVHNVDGLAHLLRVLDESVGNLEDLAATDSSFAL